MKLQNEHIQAIKKDFASMQSKEDLLNLLNFVKRIEYGEKCFPFEARQQLNMARNVFLLRQDSSIIISIPNLTHEDTVSLKSRKNPVVNGQFVRPTGV